MYLRVFMNAKVEKEFHFDGLKWLLVALLIFGGAFANSYYSGEVALLYRVLVLVALGVIAAFVAVNTTKGNAFWDLLKAAQVEVRKVIWPSRPETTQTTLVVVAVVIVTALLLWGLDTLLSYLASLIIG